MKPCETVFSRLNKNINDLINTDTLIDQKAKQYEKYARLNQIFKDQYDQDEWNIDDEEEFFAKKVDKHNSSRDELSPDEEEVSNWKPFKKPKIYKVNFFKFYS